MIDRPSGAYVRQPPYLSLDKTRKLFLDFPGIACHVRRIWLNGFHVAETDRKIFDAINVCANLTSVAIPWTMLRRGDANDWARLLRQTGKNPLQSLELLGVEIPEEQKKGPENRVDRQALLHEHVNFGQLKRLKIFGNTSFMPVCDEDLQAIARTATALEEIHISCLSTISIKGLVALIESSRKTLRVIEHAPRSSDGFYHPHPGEIEPDSSMHLCQMLTSCADLRDLSISMPSVCADLFTNPRVKWGGDLQVRALTLCPLRKEEDGKQKHEIAALSKLLTAARGLGYETALRRRSANRDPPLSIELFMSNNIFTPLSGMVHGDFALARVTSNHAFPCKQNFSFKGPYGSSGVYGKPLTDDDNEPWEVACEPEYLRAVENNWINLDI